jgi:membrane protein YqaA with SNARE-associated domain
MIGGVDVLIILIAVVDHAQAYWAAAAAVAGSLLGCLLLFMVARKGGEAYLRRHTISPREASFRAWFHEYGLLTVFVPAFVPIPLPLKIFIVSAGALEESPVTFTIVMIAARIPRYLFLAWLGTRFGNETMPYLRHHVWQFSLLAAGLFGGLYLLIGFLHKRHMTKSFPIDPR